MTTRWLWGVLLAAYLATRLGGAALLEPHSDETTYVRFAQWMHEDWARNRYVTVDGRVFGDFKEPLQYWLSSLTVALWADPLWGVRLWSVLLGLCGAAAMALLARRLFGEAEAAVLLVLLLSSEYYFYFDSVGLTEAWVYGLGAVFLAAVHAALRRPAADPRGLAALLLAAGALGLGLLAKQSALIAALLGLGIPPLVLAGEPGEGGARGATGRRLAGMYARVLLAVLAALAVFHAAIPSRFLAVRGRAYTAVHEVRSLDELLRLPLAEWLGNLGFVFTVLGRDAFAAAGVTAVTAAGVALVGGRLRRRGAPGEERAERWVCVAVLWVLSVLPAVLLLKVRYARHFGLWLSLWYLLVAASLVELLRRLRGTLRPWALGLVVAGILTVQGAAIAPPLLRHGQTDMGVLESGDTWANPIGITEMIAQVRALPPGLLFYDRQWGHPGTALEVFSGSYPQLRLEPVSQEVFDRLPEVLERAGREGLGVTFVFDRRLPGERKWADAILASPVLCAEPTVIPKRYGGRVFRNSAIVVCRARAG